MSLDRKERFGNTIMQHQISIAPLSRVENLPLNIKQTIFSINGRFPVYAVLWRRVTLRLICSVIHYLSKLQ